MIKELRFLSTALNGLGLTIQSSSIESILLKVAADEVHEKQVALMKFLSKVARDSGVGDHVYVVGGAVRDFMLGKPVKDVDVVIDIVALGAGKDSAWFAEEIMRRIPTPCSLTTNQYGVAILTIKGPFSFGGIDLSGEVIEIANTREETYGGEGGKGYKPSEILPADIKKDVLRREFNFNTLLWRLGDLGEGPDGAEVLDLTGRGVSDLKSGVLSTPKDPDVVFSDDPTRLVRLLKFVGRYGFTIPPELAESVKRNAGSLKKAPQNAIATILIRDIFEKPYARKVLGLMDELGLSQVIKEMLSEDKGFRTTISNAAKDFSPQLMADLLTRGWGKWIAPRHLSGELGARYAEVIMGLSEEEAVAFSEVFEKPPVDNERFISEHGLKGADRSRPLSIAREALLNNPGLALDPSGINDIVGEILSNKISTAAINNLPKKLASRLTLGDLVEVGDDLENPDFYFQRIYITA